MKIELSLEEVHILQRKISTADVCSEEEWEVYQKLQRQVDAAQHSVQLTGATCPTHNEPVSDLIHYECGCSTTRPRN